MDPTQQRRTPGIGSNAGSVHEPSAEDATMGRVEDMPLEKKLEVLKKFNPIEYFEENRYIDAQDSVNSWCLGQIVAVDNKTINIHFDGWSSRWDVWQKVTSYKIAPFRKNSRGYTGQNKIALRQNMTFSLDDLQLQKQRVQRFIDSDLNGFGAFETTQYLRGQLYIYVDFLMQHSSYTEEQIDAINDFFYHVLRLIVIWLKKIPKLVPLYSQIKVNPDLFLIDENIAILQSAYELLDILKKFFCCCHRCVKYYVENDKNPVPYPNQVTQKFDHINFEQNRKNHDDLDAEDIKTNIILRKNLVYGQFINFINAFADMGGFDAIVDFLKFETDNPDEKIPLEMFSLMTNPFRNCNDIFSPTFATHFVQSIKDIVMNRLRNMTEKEVKEIDKESVGRMLLDLKDFLNLVLSDVETAEIIESNQLQISLRFLKSTYLEKRLKGITEIKTMIERIEQPIKIAQYKNMQGDTRYRGSMDTEMIGVRAPKPPKWLTPEAMKDWIINEKILDVVFGENTHLEIVKRSGCILKFLAKQGALPPETVDLIWKQQGKHEEMVRVIYHTIQELVPFIDTKFINLFFAKIQTVPAAQHDDKFLEFLKDFTQKSLESNFEMKHNESSISETAALPYEEIINQREKQIITHIVDFMNNMNQLAGDEPHYGLPMFWELIQDKAPQVNNEIMQVGINSICEILKQSHSQPLRIIYLIKAFENICKGESIVQSIIIAQNIIGEYPTYEMHEQSILTQKMIIQQANRQLELVNKIIQNIVNYHNAVKEKVKSFAAQKKDLPQDVSNFTFIGKHTHEQIINHQLNFLEFLIVSSDQVVTLGIHNIDTLWQIFVHQPNFSSDQNLFLKWINHHREDSYTKREYFLFDDEERKYFFTKILCNPTYVEKISYAQVKCFHKFFKTINRQEEHIDIAKRRMRVINYENLQGLDTLWKISVESENDKAREESMDLLVDLHLKFDQSVSVENQRQIWSNFIDICMKNLESENERLVSNTLQLISRFLDRYEGKKTLKPEFKHSQFTNLQPLSITVFNRHDQQKRQVQCGYFQTLGHLRVKIAEAFDMHMNEFLMLIKNLYYDPEEDDDKYIKEIGVFQSVIIQKNPTYNPENHPKFLISNNQANYEKLFYLLSKENPQLIETSWELLQKLPVNAKLQQEIKELSGVMENAKNWERILDPKSTNKLLYSLRIINTVHANNRKDPKAQQWRYKFVQMGGFQHLLKTFINLDIKQIDTNLTMKCIEHLIIILYEFISNDKDLTKLVMDNKENVIMKIINLIDLICDYQIGLEKKRGYSIEELNKRIQHNKQKKNRYKSYMQGNKGQGGDQRHQQSQQDEEDDQESQEYNQAQQLYKQFSDDCKIVSNLFKFMQFTVFSQDPSSAVIILKYHDLEKLLIKSTLMLENWSIRVEVLSRFKEILQMKVTEQDSKQLQNVLSLLLFKVQQYADQYETRSNNFFDNLSQMIDGQTPQEFQDLQQPSEKLIFDLCNFIITREIKERTTQDTDNLLKGRMQILRSLLFKFPHCKLQAGQMITYHLLHNCLFEVPQGATTKSQARMTPPKCKNHYSRRIASQLLAVLCRDCIPNLQTVLNYMHNFNLNPSWRTNKDVDWNISLMEEKSSTGYVGIKNLGCICYMLSLFQQLFMIQGFRNDLLSVKDPNFDKVEKEENMLYQLQCLFAGLLKSEKQYVNPKGFCHAFKDYDGNPVNVVEQMDVDEFLNMLMDRLETAIKSTPQQHTITYHFGGKFADEKICKGCPHKYESTEPFMSLSIPVKNKKSIIDGLQAFVQGDMLEGDNAYYCEKCDKKVDALKRTCVKKLPRYMIIALKRFEFDYDKMMKVKVNDYCEFPMEFSMEPFTQEGLARREKFQKMTEEKGEDQDQEIQMDPLKYPQDYYEYSLTGVVVHTGTADSGHYYSFVKDREHPESGKWYELNDHVVRDFDPADIPQECYGGEETFQGYNMVQMKSMKWRNAYLLFYERKSSQDYNSDEEKEADKTDSIGKEDVEMKTVTQDVSILQDIEDKIAYENQKYWQNRFLFSNEYHEFVYDVALNWNTNCLIPKHFLTKNNDFDLVGFPKPKEYDSDYSILDPLDVKMDIDPALIPAVEEKVFKFAAQFYITILQRSQNKMYIPQMLNLLKGYINKSYNCAQWLITEFCNKAILEENLLQCGSKEMRKFIVGLLYCAMLKIYPVEKDMINSYWQDPTDPNRNNTVLGNLALVLHHNLFLVKKFVANSSQYFQLFARLSSLGTEMREFLLRARTIGRLMEFFFDEVSPHKEFFRDFSEINPKYKERPEMGMPTQIDKKQMSHFQEILEKRRMKNLMEAPPRYKYLIEAVSNCARGFKNGEHRSPYILDEIAYDALLPQERDLFIPESKFLKKVFAESKKNRSLKFVCMCYVHFTWTEKDGFTELLGVITNGLNENDYDDIRPYLMLTQFLLQHPGGDNPDQRFETVMQTFLETVKHNQIFYKFMETVLDFVFKITSRIPRVKQWFAQKKAAWAWLAQWAQEIKFPSNPADSSSQLRVFKKRNNLQLNSQYLRNEYFKNIVVREARQKRMDMLLKDQQPDLSGEVDFDLIDLQDYKFVQGEVIELYIRKQDKIQQVQVEQVLDEMINVKYLNIQQTNDNYQQPSTQWVSCDTDKLLLQGVYKSQYKIQLLDFLQAQQQQRMRQEAAQNNPQMRQGGNPNDMEYDQDNNQHFGDSDEENDSDQDADIYN